jgi:subtilase family protein
VVSTWPGPAVGDPLDGTTAGLWTRTSTTAGTGGGWAFSTGATHALIDPSTLLSGGSYNNGTNDVAWRTFNLTGASTVALHFLVSLGLSTTTSDHVRVAWAATATDPFAGGTIVADASGAGTDFFPGLSPSGFDVSGCRGPTCAIGFQLTSDASGTGPGAGIVALTLDRVDANADSYNTENGTSMATPMAAGVATMLRAYNPQYSAADVIASLKGGGRPVPALAGRTTSGNAVDAMGSLAFIQAPTGLAAVVH